MVRSLRTNTRDRALFRKGRWHALSRVLEESFRRFYTEDSPYLAASIAFYALLSIFPLSLICLSLFGLFIRRYELSEGLALVLARYLPMQPDFISGNLISISSSFGKVTLLSALLLLWAASGVFMPIQKALDRAWEIKVPRPWWRGQLVAAEMVLLVSILALISISLTGFNIFLQPLLRRLGWAQMPAPVDFVLHGGVLLASFVVTVLLFLLIYHRLPNRSLRIREVLPSALFAALFWEAARAAFTLLLPFFNYKRLYGSIGMVAMLMSWIYISSLIMLLGAQISAVLYRTVFAPEPANPLPEPEADALVSPAKAEAGRKVSTGRSLP